MHFIFKWVSAYLNRTDIAAMGNERRVFYTARGGQGLNVGGPGLGQSPQTPEIKVENTTEKWKELTIHT